MQEKARAILSGKRLIHGAEERYILPLNSTLDEPLVYSNLQYEKPEIEVDDVKLKQHPYFRFLFVRKFNDKRSVFNAKTWKWKTSIPLDVVFAFMETKDDWKVIDREHVYNVKTNELNGKKYRGDDYSNYELKRFYHPIYTNAFVDFIGRQFIQREDKLISIIDKFYRNVRFYHDGAWITIPAARFNYECFTCERTEELITLKDFTPSISKFRFENLIKKSDIEVPSNLQLHPKYKDFGYDGSNVISLQTRHPLTSPTLTIYIKGKRIYYNRERLIYECKNNRLLNADEFVIGDTLCNVTTLSFVLGKKTYYRTSNPSIYISDDDVFYAPWNRTVKAINGFINIGSKKKPNLIAIPLSDKELHTR